MEIIQEQRKYGLSSKARKFPLMCVIGLSYACNASCPHCPYSNSSIREKYKDNLFMDGNIFKTIADQCGKHKAWLRISGGGEPMLHPEAINLIEYAKSKGAKVGLITNGSVLTERKLRRLLFAQLDMLEFSADAADQKTYSNLRKGLDWYRLLKNIKKSIELRNELKSSTKIIVSCVNQVGVDIKEAERFWSPIVDVFQKRKYLTWGIIDPDRSADRAPYLSPEKLIPCPYLFERINIDSKGNVIICGFDIEAKTNLGNVLIKSIKEIWLGEEFEYYRSMHLARRGNEIDLCRNCTDWKYRSWEHNYWKIVKNAESKRNKNFSIKA